jgi:hypothetical protein
MERCELLNGWLFFNDQMKDMPTVTDNMKRECIVFGIMNSVPDKGLQLC